MSSHGTYFLVSSFNKSEYKSVLNFLEIKYVDYDWYAKCIGSSNLVKDVSEDVYVQLLVFIAEKWKKYFYSTNIKNTPLIKYLGLDNQVYVYTPFSAISMLMAVEVGDISWLIKWNTEFGCATGKYFLPQNTQNSIKSCSKVPMLLKWLKVELKVEYLDVSQYAAKLLRYSSVVNTDRKLAVTFAHFLHRSLQKKPLNEGVVTDLFKKMPIVDNYGHIYKTRSGVLVPSKGSKWLELLGANPWRQHNYIELGEDYTRSVTYFGETTSGQKLVKFLDKYVKPSDVPDLSPPNAAIPTLSSPLTKKNTFLLLGWLRKLKESGNNIPENFLSSIKHGSWLKVLLSGSYGYSRPSESFMLDSSLGKLLQNGSVIVDIPLVNEKFYGDEIKNYRKELQTIGVRFENEEVCEYIGKRFMSLAASSNLTRDDVLSMLKFIRYLGADSGTDLLVKSMREEKWVKTSRGDMTPGKSVLFSDEWNAASQISDIPFIDQDYYGNELLSFKGELERLGVTLNFNGSYQLVLDNLKFRAAFGCMSSEAMLFVLTCIQKVDSSDKLVEELKHTNCLKTKLGYKFPYECFLLNPESVWGCLLHVFGSFPVLDEEFYGKSIFSMSHELKKIGVKVDFENSSAELIRIFKQQVSLSSINKEHVLSFLECYRKLKTHDFKFSTDFQECIFKEKWIRTRIGDFRSPNECILFGKDWKSISKISVMPFIDDINFYGNEIHDYRKELKELGVVTDFKEGAKFVADGLSLPQHSSSLTIANVFALLDCVKRLEEKETKIPVKFLEKLSEKNWLKTHFGYKCPNEFDSSWDSLLKRNDGPFINEGFYGSRIGSYKNELKILGVITDTNEQCQLLAGYLKCHSNFETISRIYNYLSTFKWEPVDEENKRIWIPKGAGKGVWVMPQDCVLHDKNNLFGELNVLENCNYDNKILDFFANTFKVKIHPSVDDYCKLWKTWESSGRKITIEECCAFWEFAVLNWYPRTEDTFKNNILKLHVLDPYSNGILLLDKRDVFIGDDLFLTDLFQSCSRPIFVWFPLPSLRSLNRSELVDIYTRLGVRTLTASAQKIISDVGHAEFKPVNTKEKIIKKGLVKLILGFLADPNLKFELEKRHEAVSRILAIEAFERPEKMTVRYTLSLSSGDVVDVEPRRMVRWDKQQSKLYMQKMEGSSSEKHVMEFAFHFAEEIAEGMLWENEELVPGLSELIRSGYMVKFEEEAIDFLMKMKNMQILVEDHDYLSSAFSSSNGKLQEISSASPSPSPSPKSSPGQLFTGKKRRGNNSIMASSSSYELRSSKRRKQTDTVSVTPIIIPD